MQQNSRIILRDSVLYATNSAFPFFSFSRYFARFLGKDAVRWGKMPIFDDFLKRCLSTFYDFVLFFRFPKVQLSSPKS